MSRWRRRAGDEDGAVAVVVALALLAIFAVTALVVDGGRVHDERGDAQVAADAAALAAAWAHCTGAPATTAGLRAADANGFDDDGVTNDVTITYLGGGLFDASVWTQLDTTIAAVQGVATLETTATAVASCAGGGGRYAIFGESPGCGNSVKGTGSSVTIDGNVHSNDQLLLQNATIDGMVTSVDSHVMQNSTLTPATGNPSTVGIQTSPLSLSPSMFEPGGTYHPGSPSDYHDFGASKITVAALQSAGLLDPATKVLAAGVYITDDDIDIADSVISAPGGTTFVSRSVTANRGAISFSGNAQDLHPYSSAGGVLLYTPYIHNGNQCGPWTIKLSGSNNTWEGLIHAPNGVVDMSSASNSSVDGSIIAWSIDLSGSNITITYKDTAATAPFVRLEH